MMCPKCQIALGDSVKVCPNCGTKLSKLAFTMPAQETGSVSFGSRPTKLCPKCRKEVDKGASKCPYCQSVIGLSSSGCLGAFVFLSLTFIIVAFFAYRNAQRESEPRRYYSYRSSSLASDTAVEASSAFGIGETWTVPGQWSLTINSVSLTEDRNEYEGKKPEAVYLVDYTLENLGYDSSFYDGLYIDLSREQIVDSEAFTGYSYPLSTDYDPDDIPIGAKAHVIVCVGVDHAGDFDIIVSKNDGNFDKHSATFHCTAP
ncbi:MAG: zinc ribbon domain-containing protein [Ruminococcus sp.]|nr:zinc ribbon domain-containing protein [Ruminococcus sp.]